MIETLAGYAEQAQRDNPFLGDGMLRRLKSDLAALGPEASPARRWLIHVNLGKHELRLGRVPEAVAHYREARRQMQASRDAPPLDYDLRTAYETGVAYLRLGENENCVEQRNTESCLFPIRGAGVHRKPNGARQAAREFLDVARRAPPGSWLGLKARWLLNLAHMTLGSYPDGVPESLRIAPRAFESDQPFPRFPEVAASRGLDVFGLAGGVVTEDLDGDGLLDMMISSSDVRGQLRLFKNDGRGGFVERTREANLTGELGGLNLTHGDYDNDGDADVVVLRGGWLRRAGRHLDSLLRNNGDGTFTDVTLEAGLGGAAHPNQTGAFADYDNDGDLDLYLGAETGRASNAASDFGTAEELGYNLHAPGSLFRNDGRGGFTDVAALAGVENLRYAKGVTWGDYDGDRFPDLYVSNLGDANRLYHNNRDGTFTDVAAAAGVERPYASFAAWFWDVDNDGALDLHVNAYGGPRAPADVGAVAASYLGLPHADFELAREYLGDGRGGFREVGAEWGLTDTTFPMGANFGDLDNDGWLDIYLATGYPYYEGLMPNVAYRNREGRGFADVTTAARLGHLQKGHGVAFADLDDDGDQDLLAKMGGAYPGDGYLTALFDNPGSGRHAVQVRLTGTRSNRSAIGARLRLDVIDAGKRRSIFRHVETGASFGSHPLRREIGLGTATRIETLEVYWPTSDLTQRFHDLPADCRIEIVEGQEEYRTVPLRPLGRPAAPSN